MAGGVGGRRGAPELRRGFGVGRGWRGAGGGKHPWLHHPSMRGEAGRKQADGESNLF